LIGGIFLLLGSVVIGVAAAYAASCGFGGAVAALAGFGFVCAILVLVGSVMLYSKPEAHTMWGVITLVFAIIGFGPWNLFGGLVIGSILAIIGGALGIAFKPAAPAMGMPSMAAPTGWGAQPQAPSMGVAHCTQCGAPLAPGATRCASCGAPVR
jgi:hypothetical protein